MIDIAKIRRDVEGVGEDARFLAFMALYSSQDPEAQVEIDRIIQLRDPLIKLMFLRFLGRIPEERAVRFICWMMEDDNTVVADASRRSFERNRFEKKMNILPYLLGSVHRSALLYAIDQLSQSGQIKILDQLLALLKGADDALLDAILMAMRYLPGRRGVESLLLFATDSRAHVRFRVVLACVSYCQAGIRRMHSCLLGFLHDPEPTVRQTAVWGVGQLLYHRDVAKLMQISVQDVDAEVRQTAIMALGKFPSQKLVMHLLSALVHESDKWVAMRCESTLLNMPTALLQKGLSKVLSSAVGPLRNRAILLSAEFQRNSANFFSYLVKGLEKAGSDKERVPYLEALGIYGDPRAVPVLLKYVRASPIGGYVAMGSLIKVAPTADPLVAYLEDPAGTPILKQMVLRHFSRMEQIAPIYHKRMIRVLQGFLKSDNINIRYLGVQVLVRLSGANIQDAILEALQLEADPTSFGLMRTTLVSFFMKEPLMFVTALQRNRSNDQAFAMLQEMMPDLIWAAATVATQIPKLLGDDLVRDDHTYVIHCAKWIARQLFLGRVSLDQAIKGLDGVRCAELVLIQLTDELRPHPQLHLPVTGDLLSSRVKGGSERKRKALIELMGISLDPTAVPSLVGVICDESIKSLHSEARQSLSRIMGDRV